MKNNVKRLPDAYYKKVDGNNFKLLNLNELACREIAADSDIVMESADLFKAAGKTLDYLGQSVGQFRGKLNDEQYRLLILHRIRRNTCQGNYTKVISLLAPLLNCEDEQKLYFRDTDISGAVELVGFTLLDLVRSEYTVEEAIALIESMLPIGVRLNDANFEGTFEFGEEKNERIKDLEKNTYEELSASTYADFEYPFEYNPQAGFGSEEQTTGGYLGTIIGDSSSVHLPL